MQDTEQILFKLNEMKEAIKRVDPDYGVNYNSMLEAAGLPQASFFYKRVLVLKTISYIISKDCDIIRGFLTDYNEKVYITKFETIVFNFCNTNLKISNGTYKYDMYYFRKEQLDKCKLLTNEIDKLIDIFDSSKGLN